MSVSRAEGRRSESDLRVFWLDMGRGILVFITHHGGEREEEDRRMGVQRTPPGVVWRGHMVALSLLR